jgi:SNF2 family DNA or RNA helicase
MWENCIVSEKKVREGEESFGCILAHSMGLGKTLQVFFTSNLLALNMAFVDVDDSVIII